MISVARAFLFAPPLGPKALRTQLYYRANRIFTYDVAEMSGGHQLYGQLKESAGLARQRDRLMDRVHFQITKENVPEGTIQALDICS
jgi:hypothetical protein